MWELYDRLIDSVPADLTVLEYAVSPYWAAVRCEKGTGMARTLTGGREGGNCSRVIGSPLREIAGLLKSWNLFEASLGLAAINAALNHLSHLEDISDPQEETNGFEALMSGFTGKKVALVGSFPRMKGLEDICHLSVICRDPLLDAYPESACEYLLPEQDYVFITGTTVINKELPRLLRLSSQAQVILVGPSVPLAPVLFQYGVDALAGGMVTDEASAWMAVRQGANVNPLETGGQMVFLQR